MGLRGGFADALQDNFRHQRLAADAGGVPNAFAFVLGWVAPGRLAQLQPLPHDGPGRAQHHRNVFKGMQAVADEERDHNHVLRLRQLVAIADARVFLHEKGVDLGKKVLGADQLHLPLDGFAGILVVARAVAGDEQGGLRRPGARGKGNFSTISRARARRTSVMPGWVPTGPQ